MDLQEKNYRKAMDKLMRKNTNRCSICKFHYPRHLTVYTCVGFDKRGTLQITSQCCKDQLVKIIALGLSGPGTGDDYNERLKEHPLYDEFHAQEPKRFRSCHTPAYLNH